MQPCSNFQPRSSGVRCSRGDGTYARCPDWIRANNAGYDLKQITTLGTCPDSTSPSECGNRYATCYP